MRKKIVIKFAIVFLILGVIGLILRSIRNEWMAVPAYIFESTNNNFIVAVEHLFAGIGVPAGISSLFLMLSLVGGKKNPKYSWQSKIAKYIEGGPYYWSVTLIGSVGYVFHIFEHEMKQTTQGSYWGNPYSNVNEWQISVGIIGVIIFLSFAFTQSRHNKANSADAKKRRC